MPVELQDKSTLWPHPGGSSPATPGPDAGLGTRVARDRSLLDCTVVFRDSAFADDVAKTNAVEILRSHGIRDVRFI